MPPLRRNAEGKLLRKGGKLIRDCDCCGGDALECVPFGNTGIGNNTFVHGIPGNEGIIKISIDVIALGPRFRITIGNKFFLLTPAQLNGFQRDICKDAGVTEIKVEVEQANGIGWDYSVACLGQSCAPALRFNPLP